MKKRLFAVAVLGATIFASFAKTNDPVLMNVAGKDITLGEFEYLYHKNNAQQVKPQSLDEYVEMFINYKLKVADAEAAGIDTTATFLEEYIKFRNELADPYLSDKAVLDSIVRVSYKHMANDLTVSHIMFYGDAQHFADSIRAQIVGGKISFEDAARQYSIDKPSAQRGGLMGMVVANRYPWEFESAAHQTPVGEISPVINSGYGLHIIRVEKSEPARGEVRASHILRLTRGMSDEVAAQAKVSIDSIYNVVTAPGADFAEVAKQCSQDPGSKARGGDLEWFGPGVMIHEFDSVAFAIADGEISKPFKTAFGWHIIKKFDSRGIASFEDSREMIIKSMPRDQRGNAPRQAYLNQKIREYNGTMYYDDLAKVKDIAVQCGEKVDSNFIAALTQCTTIPACAVDGKVFYLNEVVPTMPKSAVKGKEGMYEYVKNATNSFMCARVLDKAREDLVKIEPEYRNLVNEYRDGILLFEISNRNVWDRANKDKEGLEAFFQANREKYAWDTPKFKSYIIFTANDSLLNEAVKYASSLPEDIAHGDFVSTMKTRFGRDVKIERVIAAKGENPITDFLAFNGEKPKAENARWTSYAAFRGKVLDAPQEASDARGAVVSDYQNELEKQWVKKLREQYKFKINKKVLKKVK